MIRTLILAIAFMFASPALAVNFPPLTGRVVDQANLLAPEQEAQLAQRLDALEHATSRQLVVVTVPSLQDMPIEDYGYQLGRAWRIGQTQANNGTILLVAPNERKVRIEVGYGLEPILTDALSSQIIQNEIVPRFRDGDYAGGIMAGTQAIITQLQAPPEAAEQRALQASQAQQQQQQSQGGRGSSFPIMIWVFILIFFVLPMFGAGFRGRRYRRGVSVWGPGSGRGGSGLGWLLTGVALNSLTRGGGGSSWGGGGGSSWGGGGGGGFSGGGGSFGGGGASGGW
jgi:uncharacterized protein